MKFQKGTSSWWRVLLFGAPFVYIYKQLFLILLQTQETLQTQSIYNNLENKTLHFFL
ncbi:hypothetical protein KFK09_006019 [Dendrobium nobile]|uniref:Uncharacterized protein n=1 Tax=Dendrobium nobile TaxID=94219 RepID=A0A8T3C268_DENNO|nr:hypothetical protein KFK09_006019 [Dendrobium nobile]